jgi:hypothetical protein
VRRRGQKRILAIDRPVVYRVRHGRWRGATWIEREQRRFWLCVGAQHEEGSADDAYEMFAALHQAGRLLPDNDDQLRDALERNVRIVESATDTIASVLTEAFDHPPRDITLVLGGLINARLRVPRQVKRYGLRFRLSQLTDASSRSDFATCSSAWF